MKKKLDGYYWLNHIFFTIGVLFIATLVHEIFPFMDCGGFVTSTAVVALWFFLIDKVCVIGKLSL